MGRAEEARGSRATQQEEDRQHDEMSRRGAHDGNGGEGDDACTPPMASLREDSRSLLALGRSLPRRARRGGAGNPQRRAASASSAPACLALSAGHGRRRSPEHITVSSLVCPTSPGISQWSVSISRGMMPHTSRRLPRTSSSPSRPPRSYAMLYLTWRTRERVYCSHPSPRGLLQIATH